MEEVIINPKREPGEPDLGSLGLLLVNPAEVAQAKKHANELGWQRSFLFNSNLYLSPNQKNEDVSFWAGPALGAPMAVLALEKLIALGAKRIVVFGWCGALAPQLHVGDVLLPTWAKSEEGTSQHYPIVGQAEASLALNNTLARYLRSFSDIRQGPVWTTDAPYREAREKVAHYQSEGVLGVEMEFSALATVARFRGVELAAAFLVSDELWRDKWQPGFQQKSFRQKSRAILKHLFAFRQEQGNG